MANSNSTSSVNHAGEHLLETETSRCIMVTENITATLDLEVTNYLQLNGMCVCSRFFRVGGYDWAIRFNPDERDKFYASTFVYCSGRKGKVRAKFTLKVLGKDDQVELAPFDVREHVFFPEQETGYSSFVLKANLERLSLLGDGCFTIRCVLTVMNEQSLPLELPDHLERALEDGRGADVKFHVGGRTFAAHSVMLAERSPVFDAQLFGPLMEKDMQRVEIVDMEPGIFEMLLHFIYTDLLPPCDDEGDGTAVMQHLLVAADRYGLDMLKLMCEEKLCKIIDVDTVTATLTLADQHNCKRLMHACLEFISSAAEVPDVVTDGFKHLMATRPLLISEERLMHKLSATPLGLHVFGDGGGWRKDGAVHHVGARRRVPRPETTLSRCIKVTENITATLNFEVPNYLLLRGTGIGTYVSSRFFRVGGYDWTIRFYPEERGGLHASAFLHCSGRRGETARAKFTLSMLEKKGQVQLATFDAVERVFSPGEYEWGYPKFVEKSILERSSRVGGGCFTVRCVLTVMNKQSQPLELPDHLERALTGGRRTDVTFDVGGKEFSAHRFVLAARSPVFDAQLFGPTMERDTQRIEVANMEPAIFEMILHFIYTDSLPPCNGEGHSDLMMQYLLVAADRYGLNKLKQMCTSGARIYTTTSCRCLEC